MYPGPRGYPPGPKSRTFNEVALATSVTSAAQLVTFGTAYQVVSAARDDYDIGYAGEILFAGLCSVFVFAPFILTALGVVHSLLLTLPAKWAGERLATRSPFKGSKGSKGSEVSKGFGGFGGVPLLCSVGVSLALGAAYATAIGWADWWWVALSGVLPLLGAAYAERREMSVADTWGFGAILAFTGVALTLGCALGAAKTGHYSAYEPPKLSRTQYVGVWRGEDGTELRLDADGGAAFRNLPHDGRDEDAPACDGDGTWSFSPDTGRSRDGAAVRGPGCRERIWQITGTADRPGLFLRVGNSEDDGVLVLHKETGEAKGTGEAGGKG
ncbi:hypothetical protein [Streptomyces sp. NPDC050504]|uniref:hypothetical protein n=1 Tax=Streptomyces sp. NPDC050504 TaxID=3365618 RepID=UPI0037A3EC7F